MRLESLSRLVMYCSKSTYRSWNAVLGNGRLAWCSHDCVWTLFSLISLILIGIVHYDSLDFSSIRVVWLCRSHRILTLRQLAILFLFGIISNLDFIFWFLDVFVLDVLHSLSSLLRCVKLLFKFGNRWLGLSLWVVTLSIRFGEVGIGSLSWYFSSTHVLNV